MLALARDRSRGLEQLEQLEPAHYTASEGSDRSRGLEQLEPVHYTASEGSDRSRGLEQLELCTSHGV